MCERLGYDLRFDAFGDAVLRPRNNPAYAYDIVAADCTGSPTEKIAPSAYAAKYLEWTGTTGTVTKTLTGARIDISMPLGPTLGGWSFTVVNSSAVTVATGTISANGATSDVWFYDGALNVDASNATVVTLYSGDYDAYTVTLTVSGAALARRVDCFLIYHTDSTKPRYPATFSTARNALKVEAQSAMEDMRNSVIIVGARKATVTDSDKFNTNPNNAEAEFIVERVVDKGSIASPSSANYIGEVKESIIYDNSITDNAYARYLARVFIYRYRNPRPAVQVNHTQVPVMDLNDVIYAEEKRNDSVGIDGTDPTKSVLWVTAYTHEISGKRAITTIATQAYPDYPAYEPREDIDLAAFGGKPVVNVAVSYTTLEGNVKTNLGAGAPKLCVERATGDNVGDWVVVAGLTPTSNVLTIPNSVSASWPPVPNTVFIKPVFAAPGFLSVTDTYFPSGFYAPLANGQTLTDSRNTGVHLPYQVGIVSVTILFKALAFGLSFGSRTAVLNDHNSEYYYQVSDEDLLTIGGGSKLAGRAEINATIVWKMGNKDTRLDWVGNNPYHHFFNVDYRTSSKNISLVWNQGDNASAMYTRNTAADSYSVMYRRLGPADGSGNFSDPYASAGGAPFFDPYTSELGYTVGIGADFLISGLYRISVRNADDGTTVAWLTEPTADAQNLEAHWSYFTAGSGKAFAWDGVDNIGAWNEKQSLGYANTVSGVFDTGFAPIGAGFYAWNKEDGPRALISGASDGTTGVPLFGHGKFAQWYLYIESKSDTATTIVRTDALDAAFNNGSSAAFIYTHLPEPTKAEVAIADWSSGTDYDSTDTSTTSASSAFNPGNWTAATSANGWDSADTDAAFNNQKPVRLRFRVPDRPGTLWSSFNGDTTIKLTRHVHLRANIHDQFVVYAGSSWPGSTFENTTIYNRRLSNDTHTITYPDDNYRAAKSLKWLDSDPGTEWVFTPALFKKNFQGFIDSIQFNNYLQLEELPSWAEGQRNTVAGARSRIQLAFMNYLFYLSGFVTDRSGRSVWAVNGSFLDKSKICNNAYGDWIDPATAATAATVDTYHTEWPADPITMHRRTVVTRQWTDEKVNGTDWITSQATNYTLPAGSVGRAMLRHKWGDHHPNSTTIAGLAWSSFSTDPSTGELELDNYTQWHYSRTGPGTADVPKINDTAYSLLTRQIRSLGTGTSWTWETAPDWKPCITRDFHGYRLIPPMMDDVGDRNNNHNYEGGVYQYVDMRKYVDVPNTPNTGADAAAGETWSSPVYDMTNPYDAGNGGKVRFWPGHQVSLTEEPTKTKGVDSTTVNYVRQDELTHWEDLRGVFSRGKRPAEQSIKVNPVQPYYQNVYKYDYIVRTVAWAANQYPLWQAYISNYFRMSFRSEYYWESGAFFPTTELGVERLGWLNASKTGFLATTATNAVRFDDGAWVGWKDDTDGSNSTYTGNKIAQVAEFYYLNPSENGVNGRVTTPFEADEQIVAVGPTLSTTKDMIFHMVLVDERRAVAV
jgi:hypothetical protein